MTKKMWLFALLIAVPFAFGACGDDEAEEEPPITLDGMQISDCDLGTDGCDRTLTVPVQDGAVSVAILLDGAPSGALVLADTITNPSGDVLVDFWNDVATLRVDANDGLYVTFIPNNPDVSFDAGDWKVSFFSDASTPWEGTPTLVYKNNPSTANAMDINFFFVDVPGLSAAEAQANTDFQAIVTDVEAVFGQAGISFGEIAYEDITGDDADKYGVVDLNAGELSGLFRLSRTKSNNAMNFFFVADLTDGSDFVQLGQAGGVPGPPGVHGTSRSGLVVNMASFIAANEAGDADLLAAAGNDAEIIMAHEAGHYLGLYHTTEKNGLALGGGNGTNGQDPIADTPLCPDSSDASGNGLLGANECGDSGGGGNLMFWSPPNELAANPPAFSTRTLTAGQSAILVKNALIR